MGLSGYRKPFNGCCYFPVLLISLVQIINDVLDGFISVVEVVEEGKDDGLVPLLFLDGTLALPNFLDDKVHQKLVDEKWIVEDMLDVLHSLIDVDRIHLGQDLLSENPEGLPFVLLENQLNRHSLYNFERKVGNDL